jgi:hypothetical protein
MASAFSALVYFSVVSFTFCLGLALNKDPLTSASHVAGILDVHHHVQLVF